MKNVSTAWCSKRNFSRSWVKLKDTSARWHLLERVFYYLSVFCDKTRTYFEGDVLITSSVRTFGFWPSSFSYSAGTENWKLHECGEFSIQAIWNVLCMKIFEAYLQYLTTGWVRRQCNRLPNGFFVEVGRHQSKQTRNESYALCCHGTWSIVVLFYFLSFFVLYIYILHFYVFGFYQSNPRRQIWPFLHFQKSSNT